MNFLVCKNILFWKSMDSTAHHRESTYVKERSSPASFKKECRKTPFLHRCTFYTCLSAWRTEPQGLSAILLQLQCNII